MSDRLVEQRWVEVKSKVMDRRLDVLRKMADYRAKKLERAPAGTHQYEEHEHAALMWAIAELSGIGDDVRRERLAITQLKIGSVQRAERRAEIAETLNAQFRVKIDALKAEVYRLSKLAHP